MRAGEVPPTIIDTQYAAGIGVGVGLVGCLLLLVVLIVLGVMSVTKTKLGFLGISDDNRANVTSWMSWISNACVAMSVMFIIIAAASPSWITAYMNLGSSWPNSAVPSTYLMVGLYEVCDSCVTFDKAFYPGSTVVNALAPMSIPERDDNRRSGL